jgi:hypothetical protein
MGLMAVEKLQINCNLMVELSLLNNNGFWKNSSIPQMYFVFLQHS